MSARSIVVTGGTGFVASHLVPLLESAFPGREIIRCGLGLRQLDVTDAEAVAALIQQTQPEFCIHLAAISAVPAARSDPDLAWRVNLHGTLNIARAILAHAPGCTLLYASSAEIYGHSFNAGVPLEETALLAPMNTYAATKAAADLALGAMAGEGLKVIRARPFNHTGPGQSANFVVPAFARQIARVAAGLQAPCIQVGALDPERDFLDVRDVCRAYIACLQRADDLPPGCVFNIASGTSRRVGKILERLLELAEVRAEIQTGTGLLRASEVPVALGSHAKITRLTGWEPQMSWDELLRDVLQDWTQRIHLEPA